MNDILIIPDVHGRRFWRDAVSRYPEADTIFLGDYHDPYPAERISTEESLVNFRDIIDYALTHDNVQLLLGNHDMHYLCNFGEACRYDYANAALIYALLTDNINRMAIATTRDVDGKTVLFSHAPILTDWIKTVGETEHAHLLVNRLNRLLSKIKPSPWEVEDMLGHMSEYRGGFEDFGSPVWADVHEVGNNLIPTADYCIFGHSQVKEPVINDRWADLDCRRAFLLTSNLSIIPL